MIIMEMTVLRVDKFPALTSSIFFFIGSVHFVLIIGL